MASFQRRPCKPKPNKFFYVCGRLILKSQGRHLTQEVEEAYFLYFGCKVADKDSNWAPQGVSRKLQCDSCSVDERQKNAFRCHLLSLWCDRNLQIIFMIEHLSKEHRRMFKK
ncbi:hypothetical protein AVEN_99553-1 [Araneus ventricosus]|uniref:Uncharacterized protein n=1 Tax=Araneus ventricosus TaxID=182803 RepID=A0A4Y2MCU9_ARAVE|nr:hypothetical protein AVEN_99553-1 [Araneus ventricosus]